MHSIFSSLSKAEMSKCFADSHPNRMRKVLGGNLTKSTNISLVACWILCPQDSWEINTIFPINRNCFHSRGRWQGSGDGWWCDCPTTGVHPMPLSCALKYGETGQFYVVYNWPQSRRDLSRGPFPSTFYDQVLTKILRYPKQLLGPIPLYRGRSWASEELSNLPRTPELLSSGARTPAQNSNNKGSPFWQAPHPHPAPLQKYLVLRRKREGNLHCLHPTSCP